jgi:hypothetical protein
MSRNVSCELSSLVTLSRKLIQLYSELEQIQISEGLSSSDMLGRLGFSAGESGVYPSALRHVASERMAAIASEMRLAAETLIFKEIDSVVAQIRELSSIVAPVPQSFEVYKVHTDEQMTEMLKASGDIEEYTSPDRVQLGVKKPNIVNSGSGKVGL